MPTNKRKAAKIAVSKLADRRQCVLTLDMTELNFQRLAALLVLGDRFEIDEQEPTGPMPWEEAIPLPAAAEMEIDYEAVRRSIIKQAGAIVEHNGPSMGAGIVREAVARHDGKDLASVPKENLLRLLADLETYHV